MGIKLALTVLTATVALAGCKSDETQMAEARKQVGDMCRNSPPPGVDAERFCSCVIDKSLGTKTADQMRKMSDQEAEQLGMKAASECLSQPGMIKGMAQPAPAEATEQTGEVVEEGVDEAN